MNGKTLKIGMVLLVFLLVLSSFGGCFRRAVPPGVTPTSAPYTTRATQVTPPGNGTLTSADQARLAMSKIRVAIVYDRISDGVVIGRSIDDVIGILDDTRTDLILKDFIRWEPVPDTATSAVPGYPANYAAGKAKIGYTYEQLADATNRIKAARPGTIIMGAISTQRLNNPEVNDLTGQAYPTDQAWAMAFDPAKFDLTGALGSKEDVQCKAAKALGWVPSSTTCPSGYSMADAPAFFSDITNPDYQDLLVDRAEKQIDLGADAIWIDMLYAEAMAISEETKNPNHPGARAAVDAASAVIDRIHAYGQSKGKYVPVGTWWTYVDLSYASPDLDFVTATPKSTEITGGLDGAGWDDIRRQVTGRSGNIPIIAVIDWGGSDGGVGAPLTVFSQQLTDARQDEFITSADAFFRGKGIIFAYPVHGGTFPTKSARLAFGKYNVYDALAPEFQTYGTIKQLAQAAG